MGHLDDLYVVPSAGYLFSAKDPCFFPILQLYLQKGGGGELGPGSKLRILLQSEFLLKPRPGGGLKFLIPTRTPR